MADEPQKAEDKSKSTTAPYVFLVVMVVLANIIATSLHGLGFALSMDRWFLVACFGIWLLSRILPNVNK